jgi:hypothetical protein
MTLPIALIIDDGTPANVAYGVDPEGVRVELFPCPVEKLRPGDRKRAEDEGWG